MNKIYFLLGSNLGNSTSQVQKAVEHLSERVGKIISQSSMYQTAAWGRTDQPAFVNQAVLMHTTLLAKKALEEALYIEKLMGRVRTEKYAPRLIDIDILFYEDHIIHSSDFKVPHPALPMRRFALVPLNEIAPDLVHPLLKKSVSELLAECLDKSAVKRI